MRWLSVSLVIYVLVTVTANQLNCQHSTSNTCSKNRNGRFFLDGHKVTIKSNDDQFSVSCGGWRALDLEILPRFTSELRVPTVKLICPLPTSRSIADVLAAFNVKLQSENGTILMLLDLPSNPQLSANYFNGLENLTDLQIKMLYRHTPADNFISGLKNLHSIKLTHVSIPVDDSSAGISELQLVLPAGLEKLQLVDSQEKHFVALSRCDNLRQLSFYKSNVEILPDRWVAACPYLEKIVLKSADDIVSLPSRLLEGATALKRLTISKCRSIKSLPDGFLNGAPNLIFLDLSHNKLHTLSSESFLGPSLNYLSLSFNWVTSEALKALAPLTSLTKLDLSYNQDFKNLCDENGYSQLQNLTQLKELSFWSSDITHICRDWRESMTFLENMDLRDTNIAELTFTDLQFIRDKSIKNAEVLLEEGAITSVRFTEEDYKKLLETPTTATPVTMTYGFDELQCNCQMLWTRKAMDIPNFTCAIPLDRFICNDGHDLKSKTVDQICPESATT